MKLKYTYSKSEAKFIKNNWPIYGSRYVMDKLKITKQKLSSFIYLNKLKMFRDNIVIDMNNKYLCYVLGLIWADGTVSKGDRNRIHIKMQETDLENIEWIFLKISSWKKIYCKKNKTNWQPTIRLSKTDKEFKKFLLENDYDKKSYVSPNKIISLIPVKNLKYFLRGVFDGDGCFFYKRYYKNRKAATRRDAFISSTYKQDWKYMENFCSEIGCKFYISRVVNNKEKNHKSSVFKISSGDIIRFGNYIYEDFFGLERKYKKFTEISNSYIYQKWKHD